MVPRRERAGAARRRPLGLAADDPNAGQVREVAGQARNAGAKIDALRTGHAKLVPQSVRVEHADERVEVDAGDAALGAVELALRQGGGLGRGGLIVVHCCFLFVDRDSPARWAGIGRGGRVTGMQGWENTGTWAGSIQSERLLIEPLG